MITRSLSVLMLLTAAAAADHGHDFLLVHDVLVPEPNDWMAFANGGASRQAGPDELTYEFGATVGVADRLGMMATLQYADLDGGGWTWSAAEAAVHIDLTPHGSQVMIGLHLAREIDLDDDAHTGSAPGFGPAIHHEDHEHPGDPAAEHEHRGIHQHGLDAWQARWVAEGQVGGLRIVGNLISLLPDGDNAAFGYALGLRQSLNAKLSLGIELTGDLTRSDYQEAAAGCYFSPVHPLTLKFGLGTGLSSTSPEATLRAGAVWRF